MAMRALCTGKRNRVERSVWLLLFYGSIGLSVHASSWDEILESWRKHAANIKSLQYECKNVCTELINKNGSNDLFAEEPDRAKEPVSLNCDLTFSVMGDKLACLRVSEFWNRDAQGPTIQTHYSVFDGKQNRSLIVGGRLPMGRAEDARTPADSLSNSIDVFPLWLAYDPVTGIKRHRGIGLVKFQASKEEMTCGDCRCLALSGQTGANNELTFLLHVAATPDHRPLQWSMYYKGMQQEAIVLKYDPKAADVWALSGYNISHFDRAGDVRFAIEGTVKKRQVNEAIDEAAFTIDYPEGTHVTQNGARFILKDGKLRPIKREEFGRLPPSGDL